MSKEINHENGQSKMIDGVNKVVNAVKVTLGPKGRCVAIQGGFGIPEITRDGATVAKSVDLKDPIENMGAQLVKKAAQSTEEQAGDGTSGTSVLIQEMVNRGQKYLVSGSSNINEIKSGMDKAVKWVTEFIADNSIPVDGDLEKIRRVATISANNDPTVGDLIVSCMEKVGVDGVITADVSSGLETTIDVVEGLRIERGWASPHFVTAPEDGKCVMENPAILVVGEKLSNVPQLINILEPVVKQGQPLLIICDDIDEVVLTTLVMNVLQGALRCCVVKGIDYGDARKNLMEDISVVVGAKYICPEYGMKVSDATIECLGSANKVVVSKDSCVIYEGYGDKDEIKDRLEVLKKRASDPNITDYEKTKFQKRISGLAGGIGIIMAGGASEPEKINRKATIEDAILASKSAVTEGVVPGGGYIFLEASRKGRKLFIEKTELTKDEISGAEIVLDSLKAITWTIGENSGIQGDVLIERLGNFETGSMNYGYNAKTGEYGDLVSMGVLDSAKVLRVSLENATSAASMCLLTTCTITDEPSEDSCNHCCGNK